MGKQRLLWMVLLVLASAGLARAQAVGMVLSASGDARLDRGGESRALALGDSLMVGDRVVVGAGGASYLYCPSEERISQAAASTLELGAEAARVVEGREPERKPARRCALPKVALGAESVERIGGLVARGLPPVPLYLGGAVASARPTFAWEAVAGDPVYEVAVRDEFGKVLWEVETEQSILPFPDGQPDLEAGRYLWEVVARIAGETVAQQSAKLQIKPQPELAGRTASEPGERLLLAVEFENAGYFAEAASLIRDLRREAPDDPRWTRRLLLLYWNAGLIPAVNQERQRLDKLQGSES